MGEWRAANQRSLWVVYLQQEVGGVVYEHHQGSHAHKVSAVGERDEENGGDVVNDLLFEVLHETNTTNIFYIVYYSYTFFCD